MRMAAACLMVLGFAGVAQAEPQLIGVARIDNGTDLSQTTGTLENGEPGNLLGGLGSGISYMGGDRFLMLPDRGPNAKTYDAAVDNTTSYAPRFHAFSFEMGGEKGAVSARLRSTFVLSRGGEGAEKGRFWTGRSDGGD